MAPATPGILLHQPVQFPGDALRLFLTIKSPDRFARVFEGRVLAIHFHLRQKTGDMAGIVAGSEVPIVLPSRGDTDRTKFYSIALAIAMAMSEKE